MKRSSFFPLVPMAVAAGLVAAAPAALKRTMRPLKRDSSTTPGDLGLAGRHVYFDAPHGKRLHGWWIPVDHMAPAVVLMHGWGANASVMLPLARPLHEAGFHAFLVDARGHGMSDEDDYASMPRFSEDLDGAIDWVLTQSEVSRLGVVGHSIGAAAAILATARDRYGRISCLVEVSGFSNVWDVMMESSPLGRMPAAAAWAVRRTMEYVLGASLDTIAPELHIPNITVPTMIVHGDRDDVVDVSHAFRLAEAAAGAEVRIIAGGAHADLPGFEAQLGPILGFLSTHLGAPTPSE
jgi:pimeloyl-ACP methyl ester carboxylesterase